MPHTKADFEAVHAFIVQLLSRANTLYRTVQLRLRSHFTEDFHLVSKALKRLCIDLHALGLRCCELEEECEALLRDNAGTSRCESTAKASYAELVELRTWVLAAQSAGTCDALINVLHVDLSTSRGRGINDFARKKVSIPIGITADQESNEVLKPFRSPVQETLLQGSLRHSDSDVNNRFLQILEGVATKPVHMIKAIIGQLAQQGARAYEILETSEHEPFQRTLEGLCDITRLMIACFNQVRLVLDGLDAFEDLPEILGLLSHILSTPIKQRGSEAEFTTVNVMILCRDDQAISQFITTSEGCFKCFHQDRLAKNAPALLDGKVTSSTSGTSVEAPRETPAKALRNKCLHWQTETIDRPSNLGLSHSHAKFETDHAETSIRMLAKDIASRSAERFEAASTEIDRILSYFLSNSFDEPTKDYFHGASDPDVHILELIHSTLVEFIGEVTLDQELPPFTKSPEETSVSMAIFCLRYLCLPMFSVQAKKEYRSEKRRVSYRDTRHPFYRYAAVQWMRLARYHWDDELLAASAQQLFDPANSLNFQEWVIECPRTWFPTDIGFQALSYKPFMELVSILADGDDLRIHIAASMGLHPVCARLVVLGLDVDYCGAFGAPIYCALLGPAALIGRWVHVLQDYSRLNQAEDIIAEQHATISLLLNKGADCRKKSPSKDDMISTLPFFWITGVDAELEYQFSYIFDRGSFLDVLNLTNPTKEQAKQYLNGLFRGLALLTIPFFNHDDAIDAVAVYEALWRYTLANRLDWYDMIDRQLVLNVIDDDFASFVRDGAMSSLNTMRLVSKDPRFNPNAIAQGGHPLLLRARKEGVGLVRLLIERGADTALHNDSGMTLTQLCAEEGKVEILQYLIENGVDTAVPVSIKTKGAEQGTGQNAWHFAASCGLETLSTLLDADPKNEDALFMVSDDGNTPLVDMIWQLEPLSEESDDSLKSFETTIQLLRKTSIQDTRLFHSNPPILHTAAGLGSRELIQVLLEMGAKLSLDEDGASPLHYCRVESGVSFIHYVKELCRGQPLQNTNRRTPIESIVVDRCNRRCSEIPKFTNWELLCPATKSSKDSQGRGLWERVCVDIIPRFTAT
ncbi:hypothetical protein BJ170DRAFT_730988, partial [Xylariales sp. AK1849]